MSEQLVEFKGKSVLLIGGASGMGAAAGQRLCELGASVTVMDLAEVDYPVTQYIPLDLRDGASVASVLEKINTPFDAVLACAGVADGVVGIVQINFLSQRYIIESLVDRKLLSGGGSVVMISSVAGLSWQANLKQLREFLANSSWEEAEAWLRGHQGNDTYTFSKQAMNAYVATQSMSLRSRGVRLNAVMPGPTDTPLARANQDTWLGFGQGYRDAIGVDFLQSGQIASAMLFLASSAASGVNGCSLLVDHGHITAATSGVYEEPAFAGMMG